MRPLLCFGLAISSMFALPTSVRAGFETGNSLLAQCSVEQSDPTYRQKYMACSGYVSGVYDMIELLNVAKHRNRTGSVEGFQACVPDSATRGQLTDVVIKYLKDHPEQRHLAAATIVYVALKQGFGCAIDL